MKASKLERRQESKSVHSGKSSELRSGSQPNKAKNKREQHKAKKQHKSRGLSSLSVENTERERERIQDLDSAESV